MEGRCSKGLKKELGMPGGWLRLHAVGNAELSGVGPGETDQSQMCARHVNWLGRLAGYCNDPGKKA